MAAPQRPEIFYFPNKERAYTNENKGQMANSLISLDYYTWKKQSH